MLVVVEFEEILVDDFVLPTTDQTVGRFTYEGEFEPILEIVWAITNSRTVDVLICRSVLQKMFVYGTATNLWRSKPKTFVFVIVRQGKPLLREWRKQILVLIKMLELVRIEKHAVPVPTWFLILSFSLQMIHSEVLSKVSI